jgi:hypothetical protein
MLNAALCSRFSYVPVWSRQTLALGQFHVFNGNAFPCRIRCPIGRCASADTGPTIVPLSVEACTRIVVSYRIVITSLRTTQPKQRYGYRSRTEWLCLVWQSVLAGAVVRGVQSPCCVQPSVLCAGTSCCHGYVAPTLRRDPLPPTRSLMQAHAGGAPTAAT